MKILIAVLSLLPALLRAQPAAHHQFIRDNYTKREVLITMRDGIQLFTAIYEPKDNGTVYPILMERTPYSCSPYGEDQFSSRLAPNSDLMHGKFIIVYQDVRGRYRSGGSFKEMTPAIDIKKDSTAVDESSDTYDTIEWLLKHTHNNGRVGLWGISYPGFYASASLPAAHPAIKAVSPQAPVTDEFIGDDCNHNGAFFLLDNFEFYNYFDGARKADGKDYDEVFKGDTKDVYQFFLKMGPLRNSLRPEYFDSKGIIWNQVMEHDTYDTFWRARNIRPHLKNIQPAVLVVGGWFDAEDMFGALRTYEAIENQSPGNNNWLVMGPWTHGAWAAPTWSGFGSYDFGSNLNQFYRDSIETRFFNFYLKNEGAFNPGEATVFETGTNTWKRYAQWPPLNVRKTNFYFGANGKLSTTPPGSKNSFDEYISDPSNPVPYTNVVSGQRNNEYVVEDQRFASARKDVLSFTSEVLAADTRVTGRLQANLFVSTTGTDADFIVKIIDVLPPGEPAPANNPRHFQMAGFQRLVRAEVFRGKFRNSYEKPEPFQPGEIEKITFDLNEIAHVFKKGHRIMVQVQSTWFPIIDRNPQQFMKIPEAAAGDFRSATIRVYHDVDHRSYIMLPLMQ